MGNLHYCSSALLSTKSKSSFNVQPHVHYVPSLTLQLCLHMRRPMLLTLWGNLINIQGEELFAKKEKYPIILAKHLLETPFTGLSLGTTISIFIAIEPDIPQANEFRKWLNAIWIS